MNGQVGAVRDHVAKVVVVDYFMKQGIKTTMVVLVLVLVNITKTATPTVVQVSVELLIYSISMPDGSIEKHFFSFFLDAHFQKSRKVFF